MLANISRLLRFASRLARSIAKLLRWLCAFVPELEVVLSKLPFGALSEGRLKDISPTIQGQVERFLGIGDQTLAGHKEGGASFVDKSSCLVQHGYKCGKGQCELSVQQHRDQRALHIVTLLH